MQLCNQIFLTFISLNTFNLVLIRIQNIAQTIFSNVLKKNLKKISRNFSNSREYKSVFLYKLKNKFESAIQLFSIPYFRLRGSTALFCSICLAGIGNIYLNEQKASARILSICSFTASTMTICSQHSIPKKYISHTVLHSVINQVKKRALEQ